MRKKSHQAHCLRFVGCTGFKGGNSVKTETRVGIFVLGSLAVFLYLSFNIGALRMDHKNYDTYVTFFDDAGGLDVKSAVKISGVRVGRVDHIYLREGGRTEVHLSVNKSYRLALNAYAIIQQESLLGQKFVEVDQGDFSTGTLVPGATLAMPGKSAANVGDLIDQLRDIAQNVGDITHSFRTIFASKKGKQQLEDTLQNVSNASENIASAADVIDRTLQKKEGAINGVVDNIESVTRELRTGVPKVTHAIANTAHDIRTNVLPEIAKAGAALEAVEDASMQAREGFREAEQVMEKINTGQGVIGKLINHDETYHDLKKTIHGLKEYVSRMQSLQLHVDMHSENLFKYNQNKGYADIKIRPTSDYYYQIGLVTDEFGSLERQIEDVVRRDAHGDIISTSDLTTARDRIEFADRTERITRKKHQYFVNLQIGKRFNRLGLRVGLFEGVIGSALDYYVPLNTDAVHWVTSFELFDMKGIKRINDTRPHLKWLNKVYFMKNMYTCFGVDDIMSRSSASPFFGAGLRFNDHDLKYFLGMFSGFAKK